MHHQTLLIRDRGDRFQELQEAVLPLSRRRADNVKRLLMAIETTPPDARHAKTLAAKMGVANSTYNIAAADAQQLRLLTVTAAGGHRPNEFYVNWPRIAAYAATAPASPVTRSVSEGRTEHATATQRRVSEGQDGDTPPHADMRTVRSPANASAPQRNPEASGLSRRPPQYPGGLRPNPEGTQPGGLRFPEAATAANQGAPPETNPEASDFRRPPKIPHGFNGFLIKTPSKKPMGKIPEASADRHDQEPPPHSATGDRPPPNPATSAESATTETVSKYGGWGRPLERADLVNPQTVQKLYMFAVARFKLVDTELTRVRFFTLAASVCRRSSPSYKPRAGETPVRNPVGAFTRLVKTRAWHAASQADEQTARIAILKLDRAAASALQESIP